jgi:hypothetical protein
MRSPLHGVDVAAVNIQRERDHALVDYNSMREAYGLQPVFSFEEVTENALLAKALERTYDGNLRALDTFVGALAETPALGSVVGPLLSRVLCSQFTRLKSADPFFYTSSDVFTREEQVRLRRSHLYNIIAVNFPEIAPRLVSGDVFLIPTGRDIGAEDCIVSDWQGEGICTRPCGGGRQKQIRTVVARPRNGGRPCPALVRVVRCGSPTCTGDDAQTLDCTVTEWREWGACSKTCGGGAIKLYRKISQRATAGGKDCPDLYSTRACNEQPCETSAAQADGTALASTQDPRAGKERVCV